MVTTLGIDEAVKFLRWGATGSILKVRERIPGDGSQARGWANCAVQISLMLGRPYWTWTPHGLYRRLAAEPGVETVDLAKFLEAKVISATQEVVEEGLGDSSALVRLEPEAALMKVGERISTIISSSAYLALYRFAVTEAPRFPAAAAAFFTHGPIRVKAAVNALVSHYCQTGHVHGCEIERLSQAFLSILRGNLHLQAALGCKTEPIEKDSTARTKSAVQALLRWIVERDVTVSKTRRWRVSSPQRRPIEMIPGEKYLRLPLSPKSQGNSARVVDSVFPP